MRAIETDVLATGGASWAAKMAQIGKLQDKVDLLRIGLADAKQRLALYRAEAVNTAALLRRCSGQWEVSMRSDGDWPFWLLEEDVAETSSDADWLVRLSIITIGLGVLTLAAIAVQWVAP